MSLQGSLASRKDCSGEATLLPKSVVLDICKSAQQAAPSKNLFIVLPDGDEYAGGIYRYNKDEFTLVTNKVKTSYCMELYPELNTEKVFDLGKLIEVGLIWQYLSLKVESMGFGVSQRAHQPKKVNKAVNLATSQNYTFLYSVAVRGRDRGALVEDKAEPIRIVIKEGIHLLNTPDCYKDRAIYNGTYQGVPLDIAIFNQNEKKSPNFTSIHELSQLLWACQGETDHATHGNRDSIEKNGYGRVHASGCAGHAVYPIVFVEKLADVPKGAYIYNPVGFSALNRWIRVDKTLNYDHFIQKYTPTYSKAEIEHDFQTKFSNYGILLCIDRKAPCSGFMHSKLGKAFMNPKYWAEVEAGMALAGLQLQANALGLPWKKTILSNPDDPKYRELFSLDLAERTINEMASNLKNPPKNERLSLKGNLTPIVLFSLK